MAALKDDILPSLSAIAEHIYGDPSPKKVRRLRHLIDNHDFPIKRVGARLEGRRSWIDAYYAEPDSVNDSRR
jgi:hypothetical protein